MNLTQDPFYQRCLGLSQNSKSAFIKFGAVLVKEGKIIGEGWNRLLSPDDVIRSPNGYAHHAESAAVNDALKRGYDPEGSHLYIAGRFANGQSYLPKRTFFTCVSCAKGVLLKYKLDVLIPVSGKHWMKLTAPEALASAQELTNLGRPIGEIRRELSL